MTEREETIRMVTESIRHQQGPPLPFEIFDRGNTCLCGERLPPLTARCATCAIKADIALTERYEGIEKVRRTT